MSIIPISREQWRIFGDFSRDVQHFRKFLINFKRAIRSNKINFTFVVWDLNILTGISNDNTNTFGHLFLCRKCLDIGRHLSQNTTLIVNDIEHVQYNIIIYKKLFQGISAKIM